MRRRGLWRPRWAAAAALVLVWLAPFTVRGDKRYDADRFDVHVRLEADGTVRVTETVVFRFEGGTFTQVARELPLRRTDGIEVLAAGMDGATVGMGRGAGDRRVETSRRNNRRRVVWRFPATEGAHEFSLTYLVRGLVEARDTDDVLEWTALPRDHDYRIARSAVTFEWPGEARLQSLTAGGRPVEPEGQRASFELRGLGEDDSVTLRATFAAGTAAPRPAGWQERAALRRQMAPVWASLAGTLFAVVSLLFWFFWVRSPRPPGMEAFDADAVEHPPGSLPPAAAGALLSKGGGPSTTHLMGALLELARRGFLRIDEQPPRRRGSRTFVVRREGARGATAAREMLRPHEQVLLDRVFTKEGIAQDELGMSAAFGRLVRGSSPITEAVRQELRDAGLLDGDRLRARRRMMTAAALVLAAGVVSVLLAIPFADRYGGWAFLPGAALAASSLVGFAFAAASAAQTDEGARQGARWRRYATRLRRVAGKGEAAAPLSADVLPYAVAFGAGASYASALQQRGTPLPAWFHAASPAIDQQHAAFVVLFASVASGHGGAGGGGGGAAGGGSSSAS